MRWTVVVAMLTACTTHTERVLTLPMNARALDKRSAFLKAHRRDGGVVVLSRWQVDGAQRVVVGVGEEQDANRRPLRQGAIELPIDDVALFETNVVEDVPDLLPLAVVTGVSVALSVYCLTNTKACFGSCPTFYLDGKLEAEGFSESVAPALEATDLDALGPRSGGPLTIRMTNEAYETHVVRRVQLLAAPRTPGGRVLADRDTLWRASRLAPPATCRARGGDCRERVRARDGAEWWSGADGEDLAAREEIEVTFDAQPGPLGLAISTRQTLLSTYLFYQGLAWLGQDATRRLAELDAGTSGGGRALRELLGGIEVHVRRGDEWVRAGEARETGPLATDTHLVRLPDLPAGTVSVRLRLTRGLWRIDALALATLEGQVEPMRLSPRIAPVRMSWRFGRGRAPAAGFPITTLPGDVYDFGFTLPPGEWELFLSSRGYYLEWMREEWLAEESPARAALLFMWPALALRALAPLFKAHEQEMEAAFWRSRYAE